ncbi:2-dehydropantoate 2-reductase [Roseibacillus ishigakijimensis]|uniref:2-dehydropantoate 2-reductase n=1 Tax=Roseibacillus ishigakijimensis TaxID=454146 RepID=A0A934RPA3_9BACT|nr:2-dehydropantoate 2-reductase [Roseibacillus ishigakijimensis]MBK1832629.1 2-dehydropantoate 2-reductase [Roseibacillus ishigakijimensis]
MEIRSVAIVGAGAVGSYYGCRIAQTGREVRFLLRSDYETVCQEGFRISSCEGDFDFPQPQVFRSPQELGPVDLVIVAWKATANGAAREVISPLLHEETRILTLQNGLGNIEFLEDCFGVGRVLGGICFVCINRLAAGVISHTAGGQITLGEREASGVLAQVATLFGPHVKTQVVADLPLAQWKKLVWNIPFNGLCVREGGIDTAELLARPGKEEEVRALMAEVQAAAAALGHHIRDDFADEQISKTRAMGAYKPSSMLDYVNGYPLEVEAIWGEPLRRAQAAGVTVPRLARLYRDLCQLDGAS